MDYGMLSLIGILLGLVILVWLSYKGVSLIVTVIISSLVVLVCSGMDPVSGMTNEYVTSLANFVKGNFLLLVTASMFGSILGDCGAAQDIAYSLTSALDRLKIKSKKYAALVLLMFVFAILVYGGVSGFVIVFTMVPLCKRIFKQYDIPWHLYMAIHSAGGNLFAATMLPGSPAVQNRIPIEYLGSNPMSGAVMGTIVAIFAIICSLVYIGWELNRCVRAGEGFMETGKGINATIEEEDARASAKGAAGAHGSLIKALIPIIVVLVTMNVFGVNPSFALMGGTVVCVVLYFNKFDNLFESLGQGAMDGAKMTIVVAAVTGFGGVVSASPGYEFIAASLRQIPGSPLIQLVIAINVIAGITGSASAGESIALDTFAQDFLNMGYSPDVIHRIAAIACQGLDSLPHGSSIINQLQVAHLTHKQGYRHVFVLSCLVPLVGGFVAVLCYSLGLV